MSLAHAIHIESEAEGCGRGGFTSGYRWLSPAQCLENMKVFPGLRGRTDESLHELLFQAVSSGDIRGLLYDAVVPQAHIKVYLTLYLYCANQIANKLPSDLSLSYDDLCAVFGKPVVDKKERGPDVEESGGSPPDRPVTYEKHRRLTENTTDPQISAAQAARLLLSASRVSGARIPASSAKRLVRAFLEYFRPKAQSTLRDQNCAGRRALHLRID